MGPDAMILVFWMVSTSFFILHFTFIKRLSSSSLLSAMSVVSFAYLRLLTFLPAIFIPAYASSNPAFCIMYSSYKLNKQGDNIQLWDIPFPIWNQSVASLVAQLVKSLPAMWETWVHSLGWEDPLEKGTATHSILAWRIPWSVHCLFSFCQESDHLHIWGCWYFSPGNLDSNLCFIQPSISHAVLCIEVK